MYILGMADAMKVLVVVDFQKDFVDGSLGFPEAVGLEPRIEAKVREYMDAGEMVVFTKDVHDPDNYSMTQEGRRLPIPHCVDDEGSAIYGSVAKYCHEGNTVVKDRFGSLDLADRLSFYADIEQIEICGLDGSICVLSNAVILKAAFPEVRIVVDASCTASSSKEINDKALDVLENIQIDVVNRQN